MSTNKWRQHFPAEFRLDTEGLDRADLGSYQLLLDAYWHRQGPLPDDNVALARIAKCTPDEWATTRRHLAPFFEIRGGQWIHARLADQIQNARAVTEARRQAALARHRSSKRPANAVQMQGEEHQQYVESERSAAAGPAPAVFPPGRRQGGAGRMPASLQECVDFGTRIGMLEADSRAFYEENQALGWVLCDEPILNWQAVMMKRKNHVMENRNKPNGNHKHTGRPSVDRNAGTLNAGKADQYRDFGRVL